jgi:hypothetical protein
MRILRHLTANNEQFTPFSFKRELSMQAYLIENESVLCLDDDVFASVEIIEEELTLAQGRRRMDTDGRIDILLTYSQEYIGIVELKLGQLEEEHYNQLTDYLLEKHQILEKYPDILNPELGSSPKWIGVLVGSSINPVLANKIITGSLNTDGVQIAALTIQRFRSSSGIVFVTTDTFFKDTSQIRDTTKYIFNTKKLGKGRLVLEVLKQYVEEHPDITFSELEKVFPRKCQGVGGVFSTVEEANEILTTKNRKRHFLNPNELIKLSDTTIAISSQWGIGNIGNFIDTALKLGCSIEPANG